MPLKEKERFKVNADMTVSQIRNYKRSLKEKAKEDVYKRQDMEYLEIANQLVK